MRRNDFCANTSDRLVAVTKNQWQHRGKPFLPVDLCWHWLLPRYVYYTHTTNRPYAERHLYPGLYSMMMMTHTQNIMALINDVDNAARRTIHTYLLTYVALCFIINFNLDFCQLFRRSAAGHILSQVSIYLCTWMTYCTWAFKRMAFIRRCRGWCTFLFRLCRAMWAIGLSRPNGLPSRIHANFWSSFVSVIFLSIRMCRRWLDGGHWFFYLSVYFSISIFSRRHSIDYQWCIHIGSCIRWLRSNAGGR